MNVLRFNLFGSTKEITRFCLADVLDCETKQIVSGFCCINSVYPKFLAIHHFILIGKRNGNFKYIIIEI